MSDIHVRKRGSKWYYSFECAPVNGKRKRIERVGGRTKKDALKKGIQALNEYNYSGQHFEATTISVADFLDYYMETYSKINNKYNAQLSNVSVIEKHLKPKLGTYRFSTLSPATIQEFINDKFLDSLAKSTIESIIAPLSQAFEYAIDLGYVKENPCRRIKYPKNCRPPKQREIISINEYNMIVETMKNHKPFDIAIMIGWYAGLRISETFALTWDDINFNQKTITINKQIIKRNFGTDIPKAYNEKKIKKEHSVWYFQSPKTLTSNRIIDVSDDLIKVLIEWKNEQLKNKNIYGAYKVNREHQKNPRTLEFSGILNIYHIDFSVITVKVRSTTPILYMAYQRENLATTILCYNALNIQ